MYQVGHNTYYVYERVIICDETNYLTQYRLNVGPAPHTFARERIPDLAERFMLLMRGLCM